MYYNFDTRNCPMCGEVMMETKNGFKCHYCLTEVIKKQKGVNNEKPLR